jgi:hypothetical protein
MGSRTRNSTRAKAAQPVPKVPTAEDKRTDLVASRDQVPKELLDTPALRDIRRRLGLVHDVIITVAIALEAENSGYGLDFANVLTRCAADPLCGVIVDRTTPSLYERGLRTPTLTVLIDIGHALDIEPTQLVYDTLERLQRES